MSETLRKALGELSAGLWPTAGDEKRCHERRSQNDPSLTTFQIHPDTLNDNVQCVPSRKDYVKVLLEPLSLLVLQGPSRLNFTHAIRQSPLGLEFFGWQCFNRSTAAPQETGASSRWPCLAQGEELPARVVDLQRRMALVTRGFARSRWKYVMTQT